MNSKLIESYVKALENRVEELEAKPEGILFDSLIHTKLEEFAISKNIYREVELSYTKFLAIKGKKPTKRAWSQQLADRHSIKVGQVLAIADKTYDIRRYSGE